MHSILYLLHRTTNPKGKIVDELTREIVKQFTTMKSSTGGGHVWLLGYNVIDSK